MMNTKLLEVLKPTSIYHGRSNQKTFWEENFKGVKKLFSAVNIKKCGLHNVRKHKGIKSSDKYVTLYISLKFDSLGKIKIISSESKGKFVKIRKGVDYLSGIQGQSKTTKIQKGKVCYHKCQ